MNKADFLEQVDFRYAHDALLNTNNSFADDVREQHISTIDDDSCLSQAYRQKCQKALSSYQIKREKNVADDSQYCTSIGSEVGCAFMAAKVTM
ncbi:MAG: hypothetical protein AAF380_03075 [Bacteroidota bacterium]